MNENLNLVEILKDCPIWTKLYSTAHGNVKLTEIKSNHEYPVKYITSNGSLCSVTAQGLLCSNLDAECTLFPSKEQRDWSKFNPKPKFDPKTLRPFDKVLARDYLHGKWTCGFFSHIITFDNTYMYNIGEVLYKMCIPYNNDTKHLVGTSDEAPEYYRYWEE